MKLTVDKVKLKVKHVLFLLIIIGSASIFVNAQSSYPYDFTYNGNPLVRNHGAADPDAHVWNDTVWLYCSQDHSPGYEAMDGYHAFSSTDMINWTDHGEVLHSRDITWGPSGYMWAPGVARKNGKYYLYYPHQDFSGEWRIGVAISDVPQGPFADIGAPLAGISGIDPAIFIDDDGEAYIYNNNAVVAKLKPNMTELAETPRKINYDLTKQIKDNYLEGFAEGSYMHKRNGIYYYSYSNWHNNDYQAFYAMADNPYGPFEWKGPLAPHPQGAQDHHSMIEFQDQWYYFYHIAVGVYPLLKDGQSRIACYDRLYYNTDGTIQKVVHTYGPTRLLTLDAINGNVIITPPGRSYAQGTKVTLRATGDLGYGFDSWGGDLSGSGNPASITMDSDKTVSASFVQIPTYELTTSATNGSVILTPSGRTYNEGSIVSIKALPDFGYEFAGWSGDHSGSENPSSVTMDANKSIFANFILGTGPKLAYAINCGGEAFQSSDGILYSADKDFSGGGTYSNNNSISGTLDDFLYQSERSGNMGYTINLPNGEYDVTLMFAEIFWSEAGKRKFNVSVEGNQLISNLDIFAKVGKNTPYEESFRIKLIDGKLNISLSTITDNAKISALKILTPPEKFDLNVNASNGSVVLNPPGGSYDSKTMVTLTANAQFGYAFSEWSGDLSGTLNPVTIIMNADKSISAIFAALPTFAITTNSSNGSISLDPAGESFQVGAIVYVTATPEEGYEFNNWSEDLSGSDNPQMIIMDSDKNITALFDKLTGLYNLLKFDPEQNGLRQNFPNPFATETTISYQLEKGSQVGLSVINILGQKVATLVNQYQASGFYDLVWLPFDSKGKKLESGLYMLKLEIDCESVFINRLILVQ